MSCYVSCAVAPLRVLVCAARYVAQVARFLFYVVRSCGVRLSHYEMFSAESLSAVFMYLVDIFSESPNKEDISGVVYNRSCELHPYPTHLSNESNNVAQRFSNLKFIVDIFHCEKHTKAKCVIGNPECKYHPDLPEFITERNMNMEICEQTFHLLNPLKHITRNMTYAKRLCFLKVVDDDFNTRLVSQLS